MKKSINNAMESNTYIKKVFLHTAYDLKTIEDYLENMAANGLMFVKQVGIFFYFKKCEPAKLRFCVDVFGKASMFDSRPESDTLDYITYCEESGWHYLYSNGKLQYFFTEDETATPIQTDNSMRLKLINSHTMVNDGITWIVLSIIILTQLFSGLFYRNLADMLIRFNGTFITYTLLPFIILPQIVRYLYFYIKNRRRVASGEDLYFYSPKNTKTFLYTIFTIVAIILILMGIIICSDNLWFGIILFAIMALVIVGGYIFEMKRKRQNYSRSDNITLTAIITVAMIYFLGIIIFFIVFSTGILFNKFEKFEIYDDAEHSTTTIYTGDDEIPITFDTIGVSFENTLYSSTEEYNYRSFFGTYDNYSQYIYTEDSEPTATLEYDIINTPYNFIINSYVYDNVSNFNGKDISSAEADLWDAINVYALKNEYTDSTGRLVVYNDKVVRISSDSIDFSDKNIKAILNVIP